MGSYAECWLDNLRLSTSKNSVDPDLISLFRSSDKIIAPPPFDNVPERLYQYREEDDNAHALPLVYYSAEIDVVRDRLNILGYDRDTTEDAFREWTKEALDRINDYIAELDYSDSKRSSVLLELYQRDARFFGSLTPDSWIRGLRLISESGLAQSHSSQDTEPHEDILVRYMASKEWFGFPKDEPFAALRLAIDSLSGARQLIYDVTDLVWSGYFDLDDDFVKYGMTVSANEYRSKSKTAVLTEGKTDAWILRESLRVLFPHLEDYYSFLDFDSTKYAGGSSSLVNTVKSFSGAGIVNNIVAIFDNDTAGHAGYKALKRATIAPNIAVVTLPDAEHLRNYPTIGPSGLIRCDVNGTAASIELYLGDDVLMLDNQQLTPVRWTAYDKSMNRYQGEVIDKDRLQKQFKNKLAIQSGVPGSKWDPMRAVLKAMFRAFADRNRQRIWSFRKEYGD